MAGWQVDCRCGRKRNWGWLQGSWSELPFTEVDYEGGGGGGDCGEGWFLEFEMLLTSTWRCQSGHVTVRYNSVEFREQPGRETETQDYSSRRHWQPALPWNVVVVFWGTHLPFVYFLCWKPLEASTSHPPKTTKIKGPRMRTCLVNCKCCSDWKKESRYFMVLGMKKISLWTKRKNLHDSDRSHEYHFYPFWAVALLVQLLIIYYYYYFY